MSYKKLAWTSSIRTNLNFYSFSQSHKWTRHSMIFTHPMCVQCFPTQENLTTKTLKPKVTSFVFLGFSLEALLKKWRMKPFIVLSKRQNWPPNKVVRPSNSFLRTVWTQPYLPNLATECTDSGPEKTVNGKARKAHKIGHRGQQFGARFFTPSNFNFNNMSARLLVHGCICFPMLWRL